MRERKPALLLQWQLFWPFWIRSFRGPGKAEAVQCGYQKRPQTQAKCERRGDVERTCKS